MGTLDTMLMGGTIAVSAVVIGTLVLASISIWVMEAAEVYVRALRRWVRGAARRFLAVARKEANA